jgi:sugar phosphate isomerase/epimerase
MPTDNSLSRRRLLQSAAFTAATAAIPTLAPAQAKPDTDPLHNLKVGVASYSLRKMNVDTAIKTIQRVGLKHVSLKDMHLPLKGSPEQLKAGVKKFADAGIIPISCGVVALRGNEGQIRSAFEYAKNAGIPTMVCDPAPTSLELLDKVVKEYDIRLAIHNHGPEQKDWPSPNEPYNAIKDLDPKIGLCIDVGHTTRAKVDPAEAILKYKDRLFDVHFKDIDSIAPTGKPIEAGRGVLNLHAILAALVKINYGYHVGIEYEKDADDPLPGLAETVGYIRGALAAIE